MTMGIYSSAAFKSASGLSVGALAAVEVRREIDGVLASIFADRAGVTPLTNPFNADSTGRFNFYAAGLADGYRIDVTSGAETYTLRYQPIGMLQYLDEAPDPTIDNFVGDVGSPSLPAAGLVPAPAVGDAAANKALHADGSWKAFQLAMTAASQSEMETGTEAAIRSMSPLRVAQAIAALASGSGSGSFKVVATTRDVSLASGNVAITGAGFTPKAIIVAAMVGSFGSAVGQLGIGFAASASEVFGISNATNISAGSWTLYEDRLFSLLESAVIYTIVDLVSLDSDGCTLSYTKVSTHTGTARLQILFIG